MGRKGEGGGGNRKGGGSSRGRGGGRGRGRGRGGRFKGGSDHRQSHQDDEYDPSRELGRYVFVVFHSSCVVMRINLRILLCVFSGDELNEEEPYPIKLAMWVLERSTVLSTPDGTLCSSPSSQVIGRIMVHARVYQT